MVTSMRKIELNLDDFETRTDFHRFVKEKFAFPDYYGNNLDALYECLTDITENTCVGITYSKDGYQKSVCKVFARAEEDNEHLCVFFFRRETL